MITNQDIKKLATIFATKTELQKEIGSVRSELQNESASIRSELQNESASIRSKLQKEISSVRSEMTAGFDAVMHELKAIREELTVGSYRRSENFEALENHEDRISNIESKLSF